MTARSTTPLLRADVESDFLKYATERQHVYCTHGFDGKPRKLERCLQCTIKEAVNQIHALRHDLERSMSNHSLDLSNQSAGGAVLPREGEYSCATQGCWRHNHHDGSICPSACCLREWQKYAHSATGAVIPDAELLLDNAATASQVRDLLRTYDGEETVLREAVRLGVYEPLAKLLRASATMRPTEQCPRCGFIQMIDSPSTRSGK